MERAPTSTSPRPVRWRVRPASGAGVVVGTAFAMLAMTPSLLPRDWLYQGLVSGISGAIGYGIGVLLGRLSRRSGRWRDLLTRARDRVPPTLHRWAWPLLATGVAVALLVMLTAGAGWQRQLTSAMGMPPTTTSGWLRAAPLLVLVAGAVVGAGRVVRVLSRLVARLLHRWLRFPRTLAAVTGTVVVALAVLVVVNDVLLARALAATDQVFGALNTQSHPGVTRPTDPQRSGSPASLAPWDTLGREGRRFVAGGPTRSDLAASPAGAVASPVRVYVGLDTVPGGTAQDRAELAVAELERAGGLDRPVLLLVTTTGSGWVPQAAPAALEVLYGGDTAVVATQYSYLPSWLSFVLDRTRATTEADALLTAVEARLAAVPAPERPRLLVYGESQGAYGSEGAFASLSDVRERADGVVWAGPPHAAPLWSALVERRDPGTPEVRPVYASGLVVRFGSGAEDLVSPAAPWIEPRVLYLQHPSDPVVWWSPDLLVRRPDWLAEGAGAEGRPPMRWIPVVTFWQLGFDLLNAQAVPDGYGHNYRAVVLDAWAAVAPPPGWTDADTRAAHRVLDQAG